MFQIHDPRTEQTLTVYAVHKSGSQDEMTKFLLHIDGKWRWMWASQFEPARVMRQRPTTAFKVA